jgi:predicted nuclease of predicted toxin-antitoxin system
VKILIDACLSRKTAAALRARGFDVVYVGEWPRDPGDPVILATANAENRVLVTLDEDFGELAFHRRLPHVGIIRIDGAPDDEHAEICAELLERYEAELMAGAFIVSEPGRTRVTHAGGEDA